MRNQAEEIKETMEELGDKSGSAEKQRKNVKKCDLKIMNNGK